MKLNQVETFEKSNDISINVFGYESKEGVYPLHITKSKRDVHINLLLISDNDKRHYCLITNFSRLMGDRTKNTKECFYCMTCLHGFTRKDLLDNHEELCGKQRVQKLKFPDEENKFIHFKNYKNQLRVPFVIYADFESYTEKIDTCYPNVKTSSTTYYQKHTPSGFSYMVISSEDHLSKPPVVYRGENVVDTFFKFLIEEEKYISNILSDPKPMVMTDRDETDFREAQDCHICHKVLGADRVRDHNHLTGKFRGAAHNECNLKFCFSKASQKEKSFHIPVILHNLRGYDSHLLMSGLGKLKDRQINCIPNNIEKYISFSVGNLRFIDSFQFMSTSLEKLVSNLAQEGRPNFKQLCKHIEGVEKQDLMLRKGVYCYDYVDKPERLLEKNYPIRKHFIAFCQNRMYHRMITNMPKMSGKFLNAKHWVIIMTST